VPRIGSATKTLQNEATAVGRPALLCESEELPEETSFLWQLNPRCVELSLLQLTGPGGLEFAANKKKMPKTLSS